MSIRGAVVLAAALAVGTPAVAIVRNPTGVTVNSEGATTVFISYGGLHNQESVEAFWCGALIAATPDLGSKCDPTTIWGRLPARNDLSTPSGTSGFTDIMTIPPALSRRAYAAAGRGQSQFYYVRRFRSTVGGPDEYVFVVCRMGGTGVGTPLALVDVRMRFAGDQAVTAVPPGDVLPPLSAEITYTGSGRLRGRWEVVLPGDVPPQAQDLVTEASLPAQQRPLQRRYFEVGRFDEFAAPGGRMTLQGPDPAKLPTKAAGLYLVLLRVEASEDWPGGADLAAVGEGGGILYTGGVAGFPLPPLRYYVGSPSTAFSTAQPGALTLLLPPDGAHVDGPVDLSWRETPDIAYYQVEVVDANSTRLLTAVLLPEILTYRLPSFVREQAQGSALRWRVVALSGEGKAAAVTPWRELFVKPGGSS